MLIFFKVILSSILIASFSPITNASAFNDRPIDDERQGIYMRGNYQNIFDIIEKNKEDLQKFDTKGGFPLGRVCENSILDEDSACRLVHYFLENGASVNTKHAKTGKTALHLAAVNNKVAIMNILLDNGALIDERDTTTVGATPLIFASSFSGNIDAIRLLIARGANIDAISKKEFITTNGGGMTALHWAAQEGLIDYVKEFIQAGANKELKTGKGKSVIDCLSYAKSDNKITNQSYQTIVRLLRTQDIEQDDLAIQLGTLKLDHNPNPLQDIIRNDDVIKVSEMLNSNTLTQSQLEFGLKDSVQNDKSKIIVLFKDKLPKENILLTINEQVTRLTEIRKQSYRNLAGYEEEKKVTESSLLYFQEDQSFDLGHGDGADRAMEHQRKSDFSRGKESIPFLKNKLSSLEYDIRNTNDVISSLSDRISALTRLIDFFDMLN